MEKMNYSTKQEMADKSLQKILASTIKQLKYL